MLIPFDNGHQHTKQKQLSENSQISRMKNESLNQDWEITLSDIILKI
jgi:hypothetical protein